MKPAKKVFSWVYDATNRSSRRKIHRLRSKAERSAFRREVRHLDRGTRED